MSRRRLGQLEAEVLAVLAETDGFLSTGELRERLDGDPAYTTVNTVLFRLYDKGMVERSQRGRAYVYRLTVDESGLAAERMFDHLRVASDPAGVLNQFVHGLSAEEAAALRAVLEREPSPDASPPPSGADAPRTPPRQGREGRPDGP
ncbi:BlaI/MecI/CopY family transcriptional regulator [Nocardiopsis sp. RSe5-2]|uniref:BlaI/MecI/CopY family transcriptional regulator n=1 Tax=Nocardiopsis endophytica TaxID=3018445 RepID=A0ABT4U927_9ACTN|nr:BlaI/MecI/CopY family transcriptional regulator [Nocardiopsis endophytica]MDA2813437.1 BlaI/MecI/CopY family transcriptional regulator [Nocardiopsis endophytica]